jgi:hypothetical protein
MSRKVWTIDEQQIAYKSMVNYIKSFNQNSECTTFIIKDMVHMVGVDRAFENFRKAVLEKHGKVSDELLDIIYNAMLHVKSLENAQ